MSSLAVSFAVLDDGGTASDLGVVLAAGIGSSLGGTFAAAAEQQQLPAGVLARVSAFQTVTAFALGPLAFAAAGPVAAVLGAGTVLGFGAAWSTLSCAVVLALPAVRAVRAAPSRTPGPVSPRPPGAPGRPPP